MNNDIAEQLETLLDKINEYGDFDNTKIKNWLLLATIFVWSGNKLYAFGYDEVITVFTGEVYTVTQIEKALEYVSEEVHEVGIPEFFDEIVRSDLANDSNNSREIINEIGKILASAALVNGDFTIDEVNKFCVVIDDLKNYCDKQNVKEDKTLEYYTYSITPPNILGYPEYLYQIWEEEQNDKVSKNEKTDTYRLRDEKPSESISQRKIAEETLESVLAELNGLVGLEKVKIDIQSLLNFIKICKLRSERGMKVPTISYHLVFTGNPGTGKTTVARLVAKLYYLMGILPQGQLIETDRC